MKLVDDSEFDWCKEDGLKISWKSGIPADHNELRRSSTKLTHCPRCEVKLHADPRTPKL